MRRKRVTVKERDIIARRAHGRCEYCQTPADFATQSFSVEHIVPVSRGGKSGLANLALACSGCNSHKYNKVEAPDPTDGKLVSLFNPRNENWGEHFRWNDDFTILIGLTPTGRATVQALHLNRRGVLNMRRALFAIGHHPPTHQTRA